MLQQLFNICSTMRVLRAPKKFLLALMSLMFVLRFHPAAAQGLVVKDTTITASAIFSASGFIIVGPQVRVNASGDLTLAAKRTFFISRFDIIKGGRMYVLSEGLPTGVESAAPLSPADFVVHQNYPNPFNPATQISYTLPAAAKVRIVIFNGLGQKVKTLLEAQQSPGAYSVFWDATNDAGNRVGSGVYYYRVTAGDHYMMSRKMILTK